MSISAPSTAPRLYKLTALLLAGAFLTASPLSAKEPSDTGKILTLKTVEAKYSETTSRVLLSITNNSNYYLENVQIECTYMSAGTPVALSSAYTDKLWPAMTRPIETGLYENISGKTIDTSECRIITATVIFP